MESMLVNLTSEVSEEVRTIGQNCKCLPACTSIEYEPETSKMDYDFNALARAYGINDTEISGMQFNRIIIYFKKPEFISLKRSELFGLTDFLANCGGLLGLFMGFSLLSLAEIVYFLTLRLYCVLWRRRTTKLEIHESDYPRTGLDNTDANGDK